MCKSVPDYVCIRVNNQRRSQFCCVTAARLLRMYCYGLLLQASILKQCFYLRFTAAETLEECHSIFAVAGFEDVLQI